MNRNGSRYVLIAVTVVAISRYIMITIMFIFTNYTANIGYLRTTSTLNPYYLFLEKTHLFEDPPVQRRNAPPEGFRRLQKRFTRPWSTTKHASTRSRQKHRHRSGKEWGESDPAAQAATESSYLPMSRGSALFCRFPSTISLEYSPKGHNHVP